MDSKHKDGKERLLAAAARLLAEQGTAVSTRAICEAAGVAAPTLYHYFGDRDGLLQAVVARGFAEYLERKRTLESTGDPVADIRRGWDDHAEWGTSNPAFYALMYGQVRPGHHAPAADEGELLLLEKFEAAARRGLLRVPPQVATDIVLPANVGLTLHLISHPELDGAQLSALLREAVLAGVLRGGEPTADDGVWSPAVSAIALKAALAAEPTEQLGAAELPLFASWLDRIASTPSPSTPGRTTQSSPAPSR